MTVPSTSLPLPRSHRPAGRLLFIALAIFGAGVLAVAGVVAWQRGGDDDAAIQTPAPAAVTAAAAPTLSVYLTDSAERAAALPQELASLSPATGEPVHGEVLALSAGTPEEMARAGQIIATLEQEASGYRLEVVDLRGPVGGAPRGQGGGCEPGLGAGASNVSAC